MYTRTAVGDTVDDIEERWTFEARQTMSVAMTIRVEPCESVTL